MKSSWLAIAGLILTVGLLSAGCPLTQTSSTSSLNCQECHAAVHAKWLGSAHAGGQPEVASELAQERAGETPDAVLQGADAEDCIACHAPTATLANGGMSEARALTYFFSTSDGQFNADTAATNTAAWPGVACTACHDVPSDHPTSMPTLGLFDSPTGEYVAIDTASTLCGQCHGALRFAGTDHLTYNGWMSSRHSDTQGDVADELAEERAGQTPEEVVEGDDAEDCITCHAPTAVLAQGGMTAAQALEYFFTTSAGQFSATTGPAHSSEWPSVACTACHNPMAPDALSYFNASTKRYEVMPNASELCGQCHGNLRVPDTDHRSFGIVAGTGGMGVADFQSMPGVTCIDCHMHVSDVEDTNGAMFRGHSFAVTVAESDGTSTSTSSCTHCHDSIDAENASNIIAGWKASFESLDATAQANVAAAQAAMEGVEDQDLQADLDEALFNLEYAQSDESGGCHNHEYLMSLLNDANDRALGILAALGA